MRKGSRSPERSNSPGKQGAGLFGANFPLGIDRNKITEEEINKDCITKKASANLPNKRPSMLQRIK